jgi:hypothetical protein
MSLGPRALPAGFIAPCLPSLARQPPSGELWLHEIKHDGFRVIARKEGKRVRLYSRPGNDLTSGEAGSRRGLGSVARQKRETFEQVNSRPYPIRVLNYV